MQNQSIAIPTLFLSCVVFIIYLLLLVSAPEAMFIDPDTYWHIAAGDQIRALGALPDHDSWSLSAGNERWYNIAWGWDVAVSYIYQYGGWNGLIVANAIVMSLMLALVFANCLIHTRAGISAFFTTLIFSGILCYCSIRPHQVSCLFIAGLLLLLTHVFYEKISKRWLAIVPFLMVVWVNVHGGFISAFILLGLLGLDALRDKRWLMVKALGITVFASAAACLLNPYGIGIVNGILRTLTSEAGTFIQEWQPFTFSFKNTKVYYLFAFLVLVGARPLPLARGEKWLAYGWLLLGLSSIRNLYIFGIVSSPLLAVAFQHSILAKPEKAPVRPEWVERLCELGVRMIQSWRGVASIMGLAVAVSIAMFTPAVVHLYGNDTYNPLPELDPEIQYIHEHYPHARLMNSYNLGGAMIFLARGSIPLWIDGRERTAYPESLIKDYIAVHNTSDGWFDVFDRYQLDGIIVDNGERGFLDRFAERKGWHLVFKGKIATIFMRYKR